MTATDELRRLLDERGVEWEGREDIHTDFTFWCGVHACETGPKPSLAVYHLTPAQAIAATLGAEDATGERQDGAAPMDEVRDFFYRCVPADIERWRDEDFQRVAHFFGAKVVDLREMSQEDA